MQKKSVTQLTQSYINENPSIKDCLKLGLINYSALARRIETALSLTQFDAILIACRRYRTRWGGGSVRQKEILSLLKQSKVIIKNKIAVCIVDKPNNFLQLYQLQQQIIKDQNSCNVIIGDEVVTLVIQEKYIHLVKTMFKGQIRKISEELAQVSLVFDKRIEMVSGVVAYVYGSLAEKGINILEEMSCWTELMIIIHRKDLSAVAELLSF
jgi:aspartokinase